MSSENLDRILERVRKLIATAEAYNSDADSEKDPEKAKHYANEAAQCERMADALMLKYRIDEIGEAPEAASLKPMILTFKMGESNEISGYTDWMMGSLAKHCRCKIRKYTSWTDGSWNAKVYGFESDVRYFNLLYTSVRLHMLGILLPKIDRNESLEDNCYRLHNSGYNWLQIAEMYSWKKYNSMYWGEYDGTMPPAGMKVPYYRKDEGWKPSTYVGGIYKRAYYKACKDRGEQPQKIAANGTQTYRQSAADGYVDTINRRLFLLEKSRDTGQTLVLASTFGAVDALFREDNPDLFQPAPEPVISDAKQKKVRMRKIPERKFNADAYRRGARHAESADLNGSARAGSADRRAVGD
jgi:hypothetical protein